MSKFYAYKITSYEYGSLETIFSWVSNNQDDSVYLDDASYYGLPQSEWRKPSHLKSWVKEHRPQWKWEEKECSVDNLFV